LPYVFARAPNKARGCSIEDGPRTYQSCCLTRLPLPPSTSTSTSTSRSSSSRRSHPFAYPFHRPVDRNRFLATGFHFNVFPTCPQVAARHSAPLSSRSKPPSTPRLDLDEPFLPPSIIHQLSISCGLTCACSSARNDIPFVCAGLSLARVVQHPRFACNAPTYRKRNFSHHQSLISNSL
jgi:hypothetical protein